MTINKVLILCGKYMKGINHIDYLKMVDTTLQIEDKVTRIEINFETNIVVILIFKTNERHYIHLQKLSKTLKKIYKGQDEDQFALF